MTNKNNPPLQNSLFSEINLSNSFCHLNKTKSFLSNNIIDFTDSIFINSIISHKLIENLNEIKKIKLASYSDINDHFICLNCKKVPIINFMSFKKVEYSCSCYSTDKTIDEIIIENIIKENEEGKEEEKERNNYFNGFSNFYPEIFLKCQKHKKDYLYYCKTCDENICRECLRERYFHQYHNIYFFDLYLFEMDEKIGQIDKILINDLKELKFEFNIIDDFIYLLSVVFNDYLYHPNYSHFQILFNAYDFLSKFIANINNNKIIENFELKKEVKIITKKQYFENIHNPEIIIEIHIIKSYFNDITDICKLNFINLKKLRLDENNIINIQPLKNAKFKKIEKINFQYNKLNDDNIPCLLELDFPYLVELDLYHNNFTDYNLFKLKNNKKYLPNLESLQLGSNNINWKICDKNENKTSITFNFDSIKNFGLTNGVFDNISISIFDNFILNKLEKLYLSRNNLNSLNFVKKLKATGLKEIYIHTCYLKEFYPLIKYKKLQKIYLYQNYISEIDNLDLFVEELVELIEFDLSGNNINIYDNMEILNSIKKNRKN